MSSSSPMSGLIYSKPLSAKINALVEKYLSDRGYNEVLDLFVKAVEDSDYDGDKALVRENESLEMIINEYEKYLSAQPVFNAEAGTQKVVDPAKRFYYDPALPPSAYPLTRFKTGTLVTPFDTLGIVTAVKIISFAPNHPVYISSDTALDPSHPGERFPDVCVLVSGSDKSLRCYDALSRRLVHVWHAVHGGAAIRFIQHIGGSLVLTAGMDGRYIVTDVGAGECVGDEKAHARFINAMGYDTEENLLASAGYDGLIKIYKLDIVSKKVVFRLLGQHKFLQIPTVVRFARLPESAGSQAGRLVLLACIQDSTRLFYLSVPPRLEEPGSQPTSLSVISKTNLLDAEYASSHITFTPMALDLASDGSGRYAVATSHMPNMRVVIGELGLEAHDDAEAAVAAATGDVQVKEEESAEVLAMRSKNRNNLILHNIQARAPQDKFSIPKIRWSADNNGVWVTGDDGIVRGIEVETGTVVVELGRGGGPAAAAAPARAGEPSAEADEFAGKHTDKIRDIDVGVLLPAPGGGGGEATQIVVSGGVDKRVFEFFV